MVVRRARGTGTPEDHTKALLEVDMKERMTAINASSYGFLELVPVLNDNMFSTAELDMNAKNLYDSKMKNLQN